MEIYNLGAVAVYFAVITWVFLKAVHRRAGGPRSISDEAIGARRFSGLIIGILIAEAMLGPSDALTLSQNGHLYGWAWVIFPLGAALAQVVAGIFFVPRIYKHYQGSLSIGDMFAERTGPSARVLVGLIVTAQSVAFAGVLILAGGQVLESLAGVDRIFGMLITAAVVGLYTSIGGIGVVVDTNKFQALFAWLIVIMAGAAAVVIASQHSPAIVSDLFVTPKFVEDHPIRTALALFIAYFMGELLLPTYAVRALMARSLSAARAGFLIAAGLLVVWYFTMTFAGAAGSLLPASGRLSTDDAILLDIIRSVSPEGTVWWYVLGAVVAAGLLALIHSTLNAFLNSGAVAVARDVVGAAVSDPLRQGAIERGAVIAITVGGFVVAMSGDSLIGLLLIGYTIWVPSLLAPFAWVLMNPGRRLATEAFWSAVIAGAVAWFVFEYHIDSWVPGILAGLLANVLILYSVQAWRGGRPSTSI